MNIVNTKEKFDNYGYKGEMQDLLIKHYRKLSDIFNLIKQNKDNPELLNQSINEKVISIRNEEPNIPNIDLIIPTIEKVIISNLVPNTESLEQKEKQLFEDVYTDAYSTALRWSENLETVITLSEKAKEEGFEMRSFPPPHWTVLFKDENMIRLLLRHKNIDVNAKDNDGRTPLHLAIKDKYKDMVELLFKRQDIDINVQDNNGLTPLNLAVNSDSRDIVELLLFKENKNINAQDNNEDIQLHQDIMDKRKNVVELLFKQ